MASDYVAASTRSAGDLAVIYRSDNQSSPLIETAVSIYSYNIMWFNCQSTLIQLDRQAWPDSDTWEPAPRVQWTTARPANCSVTCIMGYVMSYFNLMKTVDANQETLDRKKLHEQMKQQSCHDTIDVIINGCTNGTVRGRSLERSDFTASSVLSQHPLVSSMTW